MHANDLQLFRYTLATVWLVTGVLALGIYPQQDSLRLLEEVGLKGEMASVALYASALFDILLGILTLLRPGTLLWRAQAILVLTYTLIISICMPEYWIHPFGPLLKNLPILAILLVLARNERGIV